MAANIGWHHPEDESDQWDGFNEPGIETYAGTPVRSLAREVNQNALDARESGTVEVKIKLHQIPTNSIPDIGELRANLSACQTAAKKESRKAQVFFDRALKQLTQKKVNVLEISDYNTHGMRGPCENGTPYYAFMKAKGQSRKDEETAGGSYGIGKFAPYSASQIRTIFVSTIFQDSGGKYHQYTQGKSIFMSHDVTGKRRQGVGFWGIKDKCRPVEGVQADIPQWLQRANTKQDIRSLKGSKLTVLCFDASDHWQEALAISVAENFFGAIDGGTLRVDIDGKHVLDAKSIGAFLTEPSIEKLARHLETGGETFQDATSFLAALQDGSGVLTERSESRDLGLVEARILIDEGLPKKVCFLRNGMFVSDNLAGLKNFGDFKDFAAVVQCRSKKGNQLLRGMEPPKHDDFEPERLPTKEEQKRGARALKELARWMRDMLKRHAKDPVSDVTEIDELKDFFGEEGADGSGKGIEDVNPYGDVTIRARPLNKRSGAPRLHEGDDPGGIGEDDQGGGTGERNGDGGGGGVHGGEKEGKGGRTGVRTLEIRNVRAISSGAKSRTIGFTPMSSGRALLTLLQAGADSDYPMGVAKSSKGKVTKGKVQLLLAEGQRFALDVQLEEEYEGAVKVVVHEV